MSLFDPPEVPTTVEDYRSWSDDQLGMGMHAALEARNRADAELVKMATAADERELWRADGMTGMAPWLVEAGGVTQATAQGWVRVGRKLEGLPELTRVFSEGRLSWDKVAPAVRLLTPETDHMAEELVGWTAAMVEAEAREAAGRTRRQAKRSREDRNIAFKDDTVNGGGFLSGYLPPDMYPTVRGELLERAQQSGKNPDTGMYDATGARAADALFDLCDQATAERSDPQNATVVIHADEADIRAHAERTGPYGFERTSGAPAEELDDAPLPTGTAEGGIIDLDAILRLACDCDLEYVIETDDGTAVGIGRKGRTVPRWLRRQIICRDGRCRFNGCDRAIRHIHHIHHWAHGGPTDENNLIGLCWYHHRLVHEGGWSILGDPRDTVTFTNADGTKKFESPPFLLPKNTRRRLAAAQAGAPREPDDQI